MSLSGELTRLGRRVRYVVYDDVKNLQLRLLVALGVTALLPPFALTRIRVRVLRLGGVAVGPGTTVWGKISIAGAREAASNVVIGAECGINGGCVFDAAAPITIGDGVAMGHEVMIVTSGHRPGPPGRRAAQVYAEPVVIGRGAWLGARVVVLPGVEIGEGAVVAAGAVVNRNVEPHTLVAGVPARKVRDLGMPEPERAV
jgi:acetyltransferase-like isoleucine patch superfamily enzyme